MRCDANTSAAKCIQDRILTRTRAHPILVALATTTMTMMTTLALALPAAPASAGLYHPKPPVAAFGPLGGSCTAGDLATGTGDLGSGSKEITSLVTTCGAFEVGQEIKGTGVSGEITATAPGALTVSRPATAPGSGVALTSESRFGRPRGLAFDPVADRLYAVDEKFENLYGFDLSTPGAYTPLVGAFPLSIFTSINPGTGLAVDDSGGATQGSIYTSTSYSASPGHQNKIYSYDSSGIPRPGFPVNSPPPPSGYNSYWTALGVDPDGNVWGANLEGFKGVVYEYSAAGVPLNKISLFEGVGSSDDVSALAFDSNGDLYVSTAGAVWKVPAPAYDHPVKFAPGYGAALSVDRTTHDVYVAAEDRVSRYRSDGTLLEEFATGFGRNIRGFALDEASGDVYVSTQATDESEAKVHVFEALVLPDLVTAPVTDPTTTTVTLNGAVEPSGFTLSGCKFEWVTEAAYQATGFTSLASGGEQTCSPAFGSIATSGQTSVSAVVTGLTPGEAYRYRLSASNVNGTNTTKGVPASFALAQPGVETVGSPIRTATTARLDSRVDPHGIATSYHFEYITEAAYQANLAASEPSFTGAVSTEPHSAGSGALTELVSQYIEELNSATTYRYRAVADSGAFAGPAYGEAMALTTRASDAPLSHGHYPGPPGSDRAWEQVNLPDTSGNPVAGAADISTDGDGAVYEVTGGAPLSEAGTFSDYLFARRPAGEHPTSGWQTESVWPARSLIAFSAWQPPSGDDGLSTLLDLNFNIEAGSGVAVWRLPTAGGAPAKLYEAKPEEYAGPYFFSDDGSRALLMLEGAHVDPAHESPDGVAQLYDVSSGTPRMVGLLPGAGPSDPGPSCGVHMGQGSVNWVSRTTHWVSADGSRAFFFSAGSEPCGVSHLYMRDFAAAETTQVDGPLPGGLLGPAGPECSSAMIRSTPDSVYFWTQSRLVAEDTAVANCNGQQGGDVYRYDFVGHDLACLTCVVPGGLPANVSLHESQLTAGREIAVAPDGSRLYFTTTTRLLPGASETGSPAIYRVNTETHQLAYVAPLGPSDRVGENPGGTLAQAGSEISPSGRFLAFGSASGALDSLTDSDNGGTLQDYVYDDEDGSLLCVSCPSGGGAAPRAAAKAGNSMIYNAEPGPNMTPLADDGDFAFATPTPLVAADQNTAPAGRQPSAGEDVYEWRDGQALLVSDGLTDWPQGAAPQVAAISPDGKNLFFTEAAQLTPDALDGYQRLYDARIGGGIDFPEAAKPCPLEVCQGTPRGAPEEVEPGSVFFSGPGDLTPPALTATAPAKPKAKGLTRAQALSRALRACRSKSRSKRKRCEFTARKRYGTKSQGRATMVHAANHNRGVAR